MRRRTTLFHLDAGPARQHLQRATTIALKWLGCVSGMNADAVTYRLATRKDSLAAAQVNVRSWRESFAGLRPLGVLEGVSVDQRRRMFLGRFGTPLYRMFVAETIDDGVVGFADVGRPRDDPRHGAELYAIYVLRRHQRRGIGRHLFLLVAEAALADGLESLRLVVLEDSPFRAFYDRLGGIPGARRNATNGNDAGIVYQWTDLRSVCEALRKSACVEARAPAR